MPSYLAVCLVIAQTYATLLPTHGHNPAGGGPVRIANIDMEAVLGPNARAGLDKTTLTNLFGADAIVDCPGNSFTNIGNALSAAESLLNLVDSQQVTIDAGVCRHVEVDDTLAQLCNHGLRPLLVDSTAAKAAFNLLTTACSLKLATGTLKTTIGVSYAIFARAKTATPVRTEPSRPRDLQKRCTIQTNLPTTGCEDDVCDPKITLNGSGDCPNVGNDQSADGCSYFCEQRAARYIGPAATFDGTGFCAQSSTGSCSVTVGQSYTVEKSVSANFGLEGAGPLEAILSAGIAFSYAVSETRSIEVGQTMSGVCGQWYKVPILKHSCGTLSEYEPNFTTGEGGSFVCLVDAPLSKSTTGSCSEIQSATVSTDPNSNIPDVRIVARYANCADSVFFADDDPAQNEIWRGYYGTGSTAPHTC